MYKLISKICKNCQKEYKGFPKSFYCSSTCFGKYRGFRKGFIPWNKDKHYKIKDTSNYGHTAWNKGFKGIHLNPETEFKEGNSGYWLGKKRSLETIKKMSTALLGKKMPQVGGEKHWNWVKDRMLLQDSHKDRKGALSKDWCKRVKSRDEYKCRISNNDCDGQLEAHHILSWRDHPELRYELNNGVTLCHFHHPKKRVDEVNLIPFFQGLVMKETVL